MQKQFCLIISLLILSLIILITYNVHDLSGKGRENQYNKLVNDLNRDTTDFTSWISNKKEILNTAKDFVDNFSYDEIVRWNTLNPYLNINDDDPDISQIYIGLANGEFITGGDWVPPDDYDPRARVWYREAEDAGDTIISKVYIDRETGDRTVTISSPLHMDGRFAGVISADVFMNDISKWLSDKVNGKNIFTYLLDSEGTIIVHTLKPELEGGNIIEVSRQFGSLAGQDVIRGYFEQARDTTRTVRMEYVTDGKKVRGIIRQIEGGDWYLVAASIEPRDIVSFIRLNSNSFLFNVLMLVIVMLLLRLVIQIKRELDRKNQLLVLDNEKDFLTGIYNRRYFNLYMDNYWKTVDFGSEISLLMMDIDYFKGYNDMYGHIRGDDVLINVTNTINESIRKQDVFARYGGEEFVLVLNQVSAGDAEKVAVKIVENIYGKNIENSSSPLERITISIGVASMNKRDRVGVRQFTNRADKALYKAKEKGRNSVFVYAHGQD